MGGIRQRSSGLRHLQEKMLSLPGWAQNRSKGVLTCCRGLAGWPRRASSLGWRPLLLSCAFLSPHLKFSCPWDDGRWHQRCHSSGHHAAWSFSRDAEPPQRRTRPVAGRKPASHPPSSSGCPSACRRKESRSRSACFWGAASAVWPAAPPPETTHLGGLRQQGRAAGTMSVPHCPGLRGSERRAAGATQLWRETEAQT